MKTFAALTLVLAAGLLAADDKKAEAPKLAGTYSLVAGKKDGVATGDDAKKAKYIFDAKTISIADEGKKVFVMSYKLDGNKIDMVMVESPFPDAKGTKAYGIVAAKGDTLKLAYVEKDKDKRPKDFSGKVGFAFEFKKDKGK